MGHPDEELAGNGGVDHTGRTPRLAGRDRRERRRRRRRRPAQGGVRGAVALARQPVDEPGADGRRPGRPRPSDALPRNHRPDRTGPDLPGCGRLRPGPAREPDARRSHPGAYLPTHPPLGRFGVGAWDEGAVEVRVRGTRPRDGEMAWCLSSFGVADEGRVLIGWRARSWWTCATSSWSSR